jgi:putative effector of murein hydrolase
MSKLFGGPWEATVLVRLATAAGILVGIVCVASVTIVVGAIFGTVVGYALEAMTKEKSAAEGTLAGTKAR